MIDPERTTGLCVGGNFFYVEYKGITKIPQIKHGIIMLVRRNKQYGYLSMFNIDGQWFGPDGLFHTWSEAREAVLEMLKSQAGRLRYIADDFMNLVNQTKGVPF